MIRTKVANINISPIRLHSASSVRIPTSVYNFRNMLPIIRFLLSGYLYYKDAFKRRRMHSNVSKCNAKRCTCCTHLCTKTTITSSVNGRQFPLLIIMTWTELHVIT